MNRFKQFSLAALLSLALAPIAAADGWYSNDRSYEVTITNISATTFTPLLVVAHKKSVSLFETGGQASDELAVLAEGGATAPFEELLATLPNVIGDVESTDGLLAPGQSVTVRLDTTRRFNRISVAAMLLPTNDSFVGLNTVRAPRFAWQTLDYTAIGYDAGTEPNDELCANIPGPQCGGEGVSPNAGGEGYIRVSPGIHGEGDLTASAYDWRNPVARVSIQRVPSND
ncbi:MAG: spondin domain-containing protein [Pseudomonadota bacterium]